MGMRKQWWTSPDPDLKADPISRLAGKKSLRCFHSFRFAAAAIDGVGDEGDDDDDDA